VTTNEKYTGGARVTSMGQEWPPLATVAPPVTRYIQSNTQRHLLNINKPLRNQSIAVLSPITINRGHLLASVIKHLQDA